MRQYYIFNREDIEADIKRLGRRKARKKWRIPSPTLTGLLARWNKKEEKVEVHEEPDLYSSTPVVTFVISDLDLKRLEPADYERAWEILELIVRARHKIKKERRA